MNAGAFYLRATPPALFFILYFETGSHEVAEGLTKERERERERQGERESERAEAGREPGSSGLHLPKYWDYKRAPPRPACLCFDIGSCWIDKSHYLLRLSVNPDPPVSASQSTGITSMRHHARLGPQLKESG